MSLGRPSRDVVDDKSRLFQCLEGLYEAINSNRTSITQLEQRIVTVTDASTTINVGASSNAVSPLGSDREDAGTPGDGPSPGQSTGTNLARVWLSTPDPSLPYAVNMGSLGAGTLQQTVTLGVSTPSAFAGTTGSIPFYAAGSQLAQDNANLFWDNTNKRLGIGTAAPGFAIEVITNANAARGFKVSNTNAGTSAQVQNQLANDIGSLAYYGIASSTFAGFAPLNSGQAFVGSNATHFSIFTQSAHDVVISTTAIERMRIAAGGNVSIANLSAGGVVYATATTAVLKIGTSAEVAAAITWPAAKIILYSSGASTAPTGNTAFLFDTGDDVVELGVGIEQAWYNLGSLGAGNYERVRARWSSNVFELLSEKGGTGTVRAMTVNASTATLTLSGNSVDVNGTTGAQVGLLASVRSTPAVTVGATTSVTIGAGATGPNPSATFTATRLTVDSSVPSIASASGATWDGLKVTGAASLTGAATTLVYNSTTFAIPTITGNGAGGTVNESATVYIAGAPLPSALTLNFPYAFWVDAGVSRFDGDGSAYVFELPADATGNVSAATGRIKCVIGGATKYIRYYND